MGIKFDCEHCGQSLHVKEFLAGRRGICPHCQGRVEIPSVSARASGAEGGVSVAVEMPAPDDQPTKEMSDQAVVDHHMFLATPPRAAAGSSAGAGEVSADAMSADRIAAGAISAPGDVIGEAPHLNWYVLPPGSMTKYGPAPGDMMRSWIGEGRVAADALIWREGWPQWRVAATVFPLLTAPASAAAAAVPVQEPIAARPADVLTALPAAAPTAAPTVVPIAVPATVPGAATPAPHAVVLSIDDVAPQLSTERSPTPRTPAKLPRSQRNLIVGVLVTFVLVLLPALIYVVLHQ